MSKEEDAKMLKDHATLAEQLRTEGDELISMISNLDDQIMLCSEGRNGFLIRHLPEGWGKVPSGFESYHDIEANLGHCCPEPKRPCLECRSTD